MSGVRVEGDADLEPAASRVSSEDDGAHALRQLFDERETDAGSFGRSRQLLPDPVERLEYTS